MNPVDAVAAPIYNINNQPLTRIIWLLTGETISRSCFDFNKQLSTRSGSLVAVAHWSTFMHSLKHSKFVRALVIFTIWPFVSVVICVACALQITKTTFFANPFYQITICFLVDPPNIYLAILLCHFQNRHYSIEFDIG